MSGYIQSSTFKRKACGLDQCPCLDTPITATQIFNTLPNSPNWHFPPITPDRDNPGHYMTFNQCKTTEPENFSRPDQHLEVAVNGKCDKCPAFVFTSESDKDKHIAVVHGGKRAMATPTPPNVCKFCNLQFLNRYRLIKHQNETGHKQQTKGRPKKC